MAIQAKKKRSKGPKSKFKGRTDTGGPTTLGDRTPGDKHSGKRLEHQYSSSEPIYVDEDDEEEEVLGSDEDEQEDPHDYCKGKLKFYIFNEFSARVGVVLN